MRPGTSQGRAGMGVRPAAHSAKLPIRDGGDGWALRFGPAVPPHLICSRWDRRLLLQFSFIYFPGFVFVVFGSSACFPATWLDSDTAIRSRHGSWKAQTHTSFRRRLKIATAESEYNAQRFTWLQSPIKNPHRGIGLRAALFGHFPWDISPPLTPTGQLTERAYPRIRSLDALIRAHVPTYTHLLDTS